MFEILNPKNWSKEEKSLGDGSTIISSRVKFKDPLKSEKLQTIKSNDWVFGAVDLRAEVFADIDIKLYRKNAKGEKVELTNHKALDLLKKPNKFTTLFELLEVTSMHLDLVGEAFWLIDLNLNEIWWLEPQKVSIIPDPIKFIKGYEYQLGNTTQFYNTDEIVHFRKPDPADKYKTISPLDACGRTYNLDQHATEWNWRFFKQGGAASILIYFKKKFAKNVFNKFVAKWRESHEGTSNAHKTAFLEQEVGHIDLDRTQKDMQFVEMQDKTRDKLLSGGFRVSKSLLGLDENSNRSTIDGSQYGFRAFVNRPRLRRVFTKLNMEVIPLFGKYFGQELSYEFIDPTPQDDELLLKKRDSDLDRGVITQNEAREMKGKKPMKGGDKLRIKGVVTEDEVTEKDEIKTVKKKLKKPTKRIVVNAYLKRFKGNELKLIKSLRKYFAVQEEQILKNLKRNSDRLKKDLKNDITGNEKEMSDDLFKKIFPLILAIGESEGALAITELGLSETFNLRKIRGKLTTQTQRFAKQVTASTFDMLKSELALGIENGESEEEMGKRVKKIFKNSKTYRARTIARTETNAASNLAHKSAYDQLGVVEREWVSVHDSRTRAGHENADGQVVGKDEKFSVSGEKLNFPSDPNGSAENIINCRCRTVPHFKN